MPYPKSQILTDQFTRGNEFSLNGEPYTGPYHRFSSNRVFSGNNPNDPLTSELTPIITREDTPPEVISSEWVVEDSGYTVYTTESQAGLPPVMESPSPTNTQIENGSFMRYFVKSINSNSYYETSKDDYDKIQSRNPQIQYALYIPIRLNWIITGDRQTVYNQNLETVRLTSERNNLPGFGLFFKGDFIRYFVNEPSV